MVSNQVHNRTHDGYTRFLRSLKAVTDRSADRVLELLPPALATTLQSDVLRSTREAGVGAGYEYSTTWNAHGTLNNGQIAYFRLLSSRDREFLEHGYEELSDESRYRRFMTALDKLPEHYIEYLLDVDHDTHLAVAALEVDELGRETRGLGVARYFRDQPDADRAEVAVTIIDELHGTGLGSMLFALTGAAAWERGVRVFHAEVMPENVAMRQLAQRFGGHCISSETGLETWEIPLGED